MPRVFASVALLVLGIVVPLTVEPSETVLIVMWGLFALCILGMIVTSEPVTRWFWGGIAKRTAGYSPEEASDDDSEGRERSLRIAVAKITAELEEAKPVLEREDHNFFETYKLPTAAWVQHGDELAASDDRELHQAAARAYQAINEVNRDLDYIQTGHDMWARRIKPERGEAASKAIDIALRKLSLTSRRTGAIEIDSREP